MMKRRLAFGVAALAIAACALAGARMLPRRAASERPDVTAAGGGAADPGRQVERLIEEGVAAKRRGEMAAATRSLEAAAQLAPADARVVSALAWTYACDNQAEKAARAFRRVLEVDAPPGESYHEAQDALARLALTTPAARDREAGKYPTTLQRRSLNGVGYYLVRVDLLHPAVRFGILTAAGLPSASEPITRMIASASRRPTVAVAGTFFDKQSYKPIGDLVSNGTQLHFGGMGTALAITDKNSVDFVECPWGRHISWSGYQTVVACGPRLVRQGSVRLDPAREGFRDPHVLGSNARTAVGVTANRYLLLVCVPGDLTLRGLADLMARHAVQDAINLDGGASTCLWYKGELVVSPGRQLTNLLAVYVNQ